MSISTKQIAKKIKALRNFVDWSQSELARHTGFTSSAISQIEKGNRLPSITAIYKIAEALNIAIGELTGYAPPSSVELNVKAQTFFRKFGGINTLSEESQKIILSLIKQLKRR